MVVEEVKFGVVGLCQSIVTCGDLDLEKISFSLKTACLPPPFTTRPVAPMMLTNISNKLDLWTVYHRQPYQRKRMHRRQ